MENIRQNLKVKSHKAIKKTIRRNKKSILQLNCLSEGDQVQIIAPGSAAPVETLIQGAEYLKSWGLVPKYSDDLLNPQLYLSNTDKYRLESFKKAITDKKIKAIWCLRGGYGALRLIPELIKLKPPHAKKILIGYSDVTSLHLFLNQKWQWPTLHAPLLDRLGVDSKQNQLSEQNLLELKSSLFKFDHQLIFKNLIPLNKSAQQKKLIEATLTGGNLTVLTSSLATSIQANCDHKILFLEELCERGYRIDRCLQQLKQAGIFKKVSAVVLGDFIKGEERDGRDLVPETLTRFFSEFKFPVFKGVEAGHSDLQRPLYFNTRTVLTCGPSPQMVNFGPIYEVHKPRN